MNNISSNSLFHFTSKAENLIGILTHDFNPRYVLELTPIHSSSKIKSAVNAAFPMVCFCDISLGQIKDHIDTYGFYGIGMTKDWGMRNKLNPVIYVNDSSSLGESLSKIAEITFEARERKPTDVELESIRSIAKEYFNLLYFLKPYLGDFERNGKLFNNIRFYNEREWRYVPQLCEWSDFKPCLSVAEYNNSVTLAQGNEKLTSHKLSFEPDDIKYIFLKESKEIPAMIKALKEIKGNKFGKDVIELLTSKILTTEQILSDF